MKHIEATDSTTGSSSLTNTRLHEEALELNNFSPAATKTTADWLPPLDLGLTAPTAETAETKASDGAPSDEPISSGDETTETLDEQIERLTEEIERHGNDVDDWTLIGDLFENSVPTLNEDKQREAFDAWLKTVPEDKLPQRLKDVQAKIASMFPGMGLIEGYYGLDVAMNGDKLQDVAFTFHNLLGPVTEWMTFGNVNYSTDLYNPPAV